MDNREMQLIKREQCVDAREKQVERIEALQNSREKQIVHVLKSLESRLETGLKDIETQSSISGDQTRLSYTTTFIFSAEAVLWGILFGDDSSKWPIVILATVISIAVYEFCFKRHNRKAMKLTKEANEQEKVIRRMNIGIPSVLAYAKVSVNQYHATQDTEMKQLLYYQIIDCTKEVLDTLSVLFFDNFAQIVIANKEERKEYVPRYVVEKTLVDVRSLIVFLCEEAKNGSSFRLSTKAWEEIVDVLWVDSIGIPVSLVGRFNAILDITKSNKYVGYIANQGYCEFIDKNDYLARKTSME